MENIETSTVSSFYMISHGSSLVSTSIRLLYQLYHLRIKLMRNNLSIP